jgi:organic radical activating enzyme
MDQMKPITLEGLKDFNTICLTGGEPMLYPDRLISIIKRLKVINPKAKIYLYTALYKSEITDILPLIDGLQFSLHYPSFREDINNFTHLQYILIDKHGSYRAFIDNRIIDSIVILPKVWTRLEIKP